LKADQKADQMVELRVVLKADWTVFRMADL
jgi:hypothetical protein